MVLAVCSDSILLTAECEAGMPVSDQQMDGPSNWHSNVPPCQLSQLDGPSICWSETIYFLERLYARSLLYTTTLHITALLALPYEQSWVSG